MREDIPNTFSPMSVFVKKFGSNARSHIKKLEGDKTFRIRRFNEKGTSKKETEFWTYLSVEELTEQQLDSITTLLRSEGYPNLEIMSKPKVDIPKVDKPRVSKKKKVEKK